MPTGSTTHKMPGKTFVKIDGVSGVHALGFGKAAPRADFPAMYMAATVNGVEGVLRSDDTAKTWVRINDDQHQWGQIVLVMGDPKQYGRAYVGAAGRGISRRSAEEVSGGALPRRHVSMPRGSQDRRSKLVPRARWIRRRPQFWSLHWTANVMMSAPLESCHKSFVIAFIKARHAHPNREPGAMPLR